MSDAPVRPEEERSTLHDGVGAYALNSLSPVDRYAFEAHLAECGECRREYARYQAVATFLPDILARIDDGRTQRPNDLVEEQPSPEVEESEPVLATPSDSQSLTVGDTEGDGTYQNQTVQAETEEGSLTFVPDEPPVDDDSVESPANDNDDAPGVAGEAVVDSVVVEGDPLFEEAAIEPSFAVDSGESRTPDDATSTGELPAEISPPVEALPVDDEDGEKHASDPASEEGEVRPVRRKRPRGRVTSGVQPDEAKIPTPSKWWWIATAIIGTIGLGSFVWALITTEQKGDLETEISSLTGQIADFETAQQQYLDETPAIVLQVVPTTLGSPDATGSIFADPAGSSAVLSVAGMPPLGSDSTYQVWYLPTAGGESVPGPTFTTDASGSSVVQLDPGVASFAAMGITIEPAGGSTVPSANPVMQTA